jgi:hypothetical protein
MDHEVGAGEEGSGDDRKTAYVGQGQASKPTVAARLDPEASGRGAGGGGYGRMREDGCLGHASTAARGDNEGIAVFGFEGALAGMAALPIDDPAGAEGLEEAPAGGFSEPAVERGDRLAAFPCLTEGSYEVGAAGEVEGDEFGHGDSLGFSRAKR